MISLKNVTLFSHNIHIFFDFSVKKGEQILISGQSGAGKSTLLALIAGFVMPDSGEIFIDGKNVTFFPARERNVTILFQEHNLFMHLSVLQNLALGLKPSLKICENERDKILNMAKIFEISELLNRDPKTLSGGQKQRVALCRALLQEKSIMLLDEPFTGLHHEISREIFAKIQDLCRQKNITLLLVSHENEPLDRKIIISNGRIL